MMRCGACGGLQGFPAGAVAPFTNPETGASGYCGPADQWVYGEGFGADSGVPVCVPAPTTPPAGNGSQGGTGGTVERFRVLLMTQDGLVDSGVLDAGCDPSDPDAYRGRFDSTAPRYDNPCDPIQFGSLADAVYYAKTHGETPVMVESLDEALAFLSGEQAIPSDRIITEVPSGDGIGWLVLAGIAAKAAGFI